MVETHRVQCLELENVSKARTQWPLKLPRYRGILSLAQTSAQSKWTKGRNCLKERTQKTPLYCDTTWFFTIPPGHTSMFLWCLETPLTTIRTCMVFETSSSSPWTSGFQQNWRFRSISPLETYLLCSLPLHPAQPGTLLAVYLFSLAFFSGRILCFLHTALWRSSHTSEASRWLLREESTVFLQEQSSSDIRRGCLF